MRTLDSARWPGDAFSGDVLPVHLREAMVFYLSKFPPRGVLIFNTVNRFLNLGPVLSNLARDAGLVSLVPTSAKLSKATADIPPAVSDGPRRVDFGILANDSRKTVLPYRPAMPA